MANDVTVVLAIEGRMRVAATQPHRIVQWQRAGASEEETSYLFSLSEKPFSRACEPRVLRIMEPHMEDQQHNNMFIFDTLGERQAARRMFNPTQGTSGVPGSWRGRGGREGWSEGEEEGEEAAAMGSGSAADAATAAALPRRLSARHCLPCAPRRAESGRRACAGNGARLARWRGRVRRRRGVTLSGSAVGRARASGAGVTPRATPCATSRRGVRARWPSTLRRASTARGLSGRTRRASLWGAAPRTTVTWLL